MYSPCTGKYPVLSEHDRVGLPAKKAWPGAETREGLKNALKKIRKDEFVQVASMHHTIGFAVPVYKNEKVITSVSVFIPESRYSEANRGKLFKAIQKTAKRVSDNLSR